MPDPAKTPKLWHLPYSQTVGGFYQSEVFIVANTRDEAEGRLRRKVSEWLRDPECAEGGGFYHGTAKEPWNDWDDEEEIEAKYRAKMEELEAELHKLVELVELDDLAIVRHST